MANVSNLGKHTRKGQMALDSVVSVIIFLIGLYVLLILFQPLTLEMLWPALDNATAFPNAAVIKTIILLIPVAMVFSGIVLAVKSIQGREPPPQVYYR